MANYYLEVCGECNIAYLDKSCPLCDAKKEIDLLNEEIANLKE